MTKKQAVFAFILAVFLFLPGLCLLSACEKGKPQIEYIEALLMQNSADGGHSSVVDYGRTENLEKFDIKVYFKDETVADLALEDVSVEVKYSQIVTLENKNWIESTLSEYLSKVSEGALDVGIWNLTFNYKGFSSDIAVTVNKIDDDSFYVLTLRDNLHTYLDENCIEYGTKLQAVQHGVTKDLGAENIEENQIEDIYMLYTFEDDAWQPLNVSDLSNEQIVALPMPKMITNSEAEGFGLFKLENTEYMACGAYYVCAKINAGNNYYSAWTEYTKFKIEAAKYFVQTGDFAITYTYNGDIQTQDILFSEIMKDLSNVKISGSMNLVVKSDMNDKNNTTSSTASKMTLEEYYTRSFNNETWAVGHAENDVCMFGNFVDVHQTERYNFSEDGHTVKVLFVPNIENQSCYTQSDEFEIKLIVVRGTVTSPKVVDASGISDDESTTNQSLSLYINCEKTKIVKNSDYDTALGEFRNNILVLSTNADCNYNEDSKIYTFFVSSAGSYFIKIFVNPNFVFDTTSFDLSDLYTVEFQEETQECCAYLTISWGVTELG